MIEELAPAKVNLFLHVGGLRGDGLHDLASLFVFVDVGDTITVAPSNEISLTIDGPFSAPLQGEPLERNLVWRAAEGLKGAAGVSTGAAIKLHKALPIAAGIGGGSADAAAALRALIRLWDVNMSDRALEALAFDLGADVPACLARAPVEVSGAGEVMTPAPTLGPLFICLVNSGVAMPTGPVFREFDTAHPAPPTPVMARIATPDAHGVQALIKNSRNDLQSIAIELAPQIADVIEIIGQSEGCLGARMSGSGATCFGLFSSLEAASKAAAIAAAQGWWSAPGTVYRGT